MPSDVKLLEPNRVPSVVKTNAPLEQADDVRFEAFVRAHQDMVFATAVRLLGRVADAEDVAQDVFLRAFQHFQALVDSPTAAGWLRTAARNASLDHLTRYRARWRLFSELTRDASDEEDEGVWGAQVLPVLADGHDEARALEFALRQLPDAHRVPLVLHHFEGMSYQDIAGQLRVSLGTVKTDIHRGREALKTVLTRHGTR